MKRPPILVLTGSRSGSSLLMRILERHGLWVGVSKPPTHGYAVYENADLGRFLDAHWKNPSAIEVRPKPEVQFREYVMGLYPEGVRAVFKAHATLWNVWSVEFPDADMIVSTRDTQAMAESFSEKRKNMTIESAIGHMQARQKILRGIADERGLPVLNMTAVVNGDLSVLQSEMARLGITMDPKLVRSCIVPRLWRH